MLQITDVIVGIDVGTSSVKAAFVSSDGLALERKCVGLSPVRGDDGQSTQNPWEWIHAIDQCISAASKYQIRAIGLCVNCSTLVPILSYNADPIDQALLWNDTRDLASAQEIENALRRRGIFRSIRSNEPCARFLKTSRESPRYIHYLSFPEAATWIIHHLTGHWVLPRSIYYGRWGQVADPYVQSLLFSDFPDIELVYSRSIAPLVRWSDCVGFVNFSHTCAATAVRSAPLFCPGNDGITALLGSGYLPVKQAEYFILGTSKLYLIPSDGTPVGSSINGTQEWIGPSDILFGHSFILRECSIDVKDLLKSRIAEALSASHSNSPITICLIGAGASMIHEVPRDFVGFVRCGQYAGAVGAAAFAGMGAGVLPADLDATSKMIRQNWGAIQ